MFQCVIVFYYMIFIYFFELKRMAVFMALEFKKNEKAEKNLSFQTPLKYCYCERVADKPPVWGSRKVSFIGKLQKFLV